MNSLEFFSCKSKHLSQSKLALSTNTSYLCLLSLKMETFSSPSNSLVKVLQNYLRTVQFSSTVFSNDSFSLIGEAQLWCYISYSMVKGRMLKRPLHF